MQKFARVFVLSLLGVAAIAVPCGAQAPTIPLDPRVTFPGRNTQSGLSGQQFQIVDFNTQLAYQQVTFAINFLRAAQNEITSGQNQAFNAAFGDFYVPGAFAGQFQQTVPVVQVIPRFLSGGGYVEQGNPFELIGVDTNFTAELRKTSTSVYPVDMIMVTFFLYDPDLNQDPILRIQPAGYVRQITGVLGPDRLGVFPELPVIDEDDARRLLLVLNRPGKDPRGGLTTGLQQQVNTIQYQRVLQTFEAIQRNLGAGILFRGGQAAAGSASFQANYSNTRGTNIADTTGRVVGTTSGTLNTVLLSNGIDLPMTGGNLWANRAFRQSGYSTSNSTENSVTTNAGNLQRIFYRFDNDNDPKTPLQQLTALAVPPNASGNPVDDANLPYGGMPRNINWTSDDGLVDQFNYTGAQGLVGATVTNITNPGFMIPPPSGGTVTGRGRIFTFNQFGVIQHQAFPSNQAPQDVWYDTFATIWGNNSNPSIQNVAPSFFFGQLYPGNYFGGGNNNQLNTRQFPTTTDLDGNVVPAEWWQLIIESVAEKDRIFADGDFFGIGTQLSTTAFVGIQRFINQFFTGNTAPLDPDGTFLQSRDGMNYARFASLFVPGGLNGGPDLTEVEPAGKRATAGFLPVIPSTQFNLPPPGGFPMP